MKIERHGDLAVYRKAFDAAMLMFRESREFPKEETYSLTDQMRRSSRSVCANLAEAWRKRRYKGAFVAKVSDAESEAAETQVGIDFARKCSYLSDSSAVSLNKNCDEILRMIVAMINRPEAWIISR